MKSNKSGVTVTFEYDKWYDAPNRHDDVVKVIRCKDCKWYEFDRKMHCGLPHGVRSKDDYCSDAERKEE